MKLKDIIESPSGLRFMLDSLELQSGYARRVLLESNMMLFASDIELAYSKLRKYHDGVVICAENLAHRQMLQFRLQGLRDISGTLKNLSHLALLDDIELFEIKNLALLSCDVIDIFKKMNLPSSIADIIDLNEVVDILNPDPVRLASFYIYDSYSAELRALREQLKGKPTNTDDIHAKAAAIEDDIRARLTQQLFQHAPALKKTLRSLAQIDIELAKVIQMNQLGLCIPSISQNGDAEYSGLFHPEVGAALSARKQSFQPIDIKFGSTPTLLIGANMGGKTVVLKSLALSQYLFQFGFGIPAQSATIAIMDEVHFCIGDEQSSSEGLSSFAAEMKRIDRLIQAVKSGLNVIALIDEPARTTNPIEGAALVEALINILIHKRLNLIVTTHYSISTTKCRGLRVRGLIDGKMDYTLVESRSGEVPHEALRIAESLGIDDEWINEARRILNNL